MPKKTKLGKSRLDKFYHLAKEQGYRSRAAFKLVQLNKKYDFLGKSKVVLDLCAAPGSWAQVASKHMPVSSIIIAVDLVPIKPIKNVICLQEDITTDKCKAAIKHHIKTWKVDTVLNDGAPNVGSNWSKDAYNQSELSLHALKLATTFLATGGTFITKVFRSQDYNALLWVFNQLFKRVESTKPQASRNESAEIFVVCLDYLAPKKIDPKLLDPKYVFAELDLNPAKRPNVLQAKKEGRHRDGYEVGVTLLYKEISAGDFVRHEDALQVLTDYNKLVFGSSEDDKQLLADPHTDAEIKECCKDLRVLGKREFRNLLRWRDSMKKVLGCEDPEKDDKKTKGADEDEDEEEEEEQDEETKLLDEVDGLRKKAMAREKRRRRKEREVKAKYQRRVDLKMENPDDVLTVPEEMGLFSLRQINNAKGLRALDDGTKQADEFVDGEDESSGAEGGEGEESEGESEEEDEEAARKRAMEEELDLLYESYCVRTGQHKAKKVTMGKKEKKDKDAMLQSFKAGYMTEPGFVPDLTRDVTADDDSDEEAQPSGGAGEDSDAGDDDNEDGADAAAGAGSNPLVDDLGSAAAESKARREADRQAALLWFQNPIFNEVKWDAVAPAPAGAAAAAPGKGAKAGGGGGEATGTRAGKKRGRGEEADAPAPAAAAAAAGEMRDGKRVAGPAAGPAAAGAAGGAVNGAGRKAAAAAAEAAADEDDGFEVAPAEKSDDSGSEGSVDSEEEDEYEDEDAQAEIAAVGAALLRKKLRKEDLIDSCYHSWKGLPYVSVVVLPSLMGVFQFSGWYAFNDSDLAPRWFKDAERKYNRRQLPVTKEMVDEQRRRGLEIAARPIKKVAEAKARKKLKAVRAQQKLSNKADALSNDAELDDRSKMRALQKLYAKGAPVKRPKSVTVIAKKGKGPSNGKRGTKIVDRRMKKDMAATARTGNRNFKGGNKARKAHSKHGAHGTKGKTNFKKQKK